MLAVYAHITFGSRETAYIIEWRCDVANRKVPDSEGTLLSGYFFTGVGENCAEERALVVETRAP